jgi:hypothetical protein
LRSEFDDSSHSPRDDADPRHPSSDAVQRSRSKSWLGIEQQVRTLPLWGGSIGSDKYVTPPEINPVSQVWHTPVRHDHFTGTSQASASSSRLRHEGSQPIVSPLRTNETRGPGPGGPGGGCGERFGAPRSVPGRRRAQATGRSVRKGRQLEGFRHHRRSSDHRPEPCLLDRRGESPAQAGKAEGKLWNQSRSVSGPGNERKGAAGQRDRLVGIGMGIGCVNSQRRAVWAWVWGPS